jgi:SAM-dependent methyltransferase
MVIEHVPSDEAMLRQIARVLRAGGRAYISTVFKKPWAWYFHRCNGRWALDPTHVREYTREGQLLDLLTRAGLTVLHSRKTLLAYPLIDPLLRVLGCSRQVYLHSFLLRALRRIKLPILGYFNWEIVCQKM